MDMSLEVRRADHIIWAAAGDYSFAPNFRAFDRTGQADFYWNFILGAAHRYFNMAEIDHFLELCQHQYEADLFTNLTWIGLEHAIFEKARADWENLAELRREFAEAYIKDLDITQLIDYFDLIKLAYFEDALGMPAKVTNVQRKLLEELKIPGTADTQEAIRRLQRIFKTYFYRDIKAEPDRKLNLAWRIHLPGGRPGMILRLFLRRAGILRTEVYSGIVAESVFKEKTVGRFHLSGGKTQRREIEQQFGKSLLSKQATEELEAKNCRGIHDGIHIHLAGAPPGDAGGEAARQLKSNLEYYRSYLNRNRNIVARLTQSIAQILERDTEVEKVRTTHGDLLAGKCWRGIKLNDPRIFSKQLYHEQFDLSFDILVDASASQLKRQEEIAQAAYIMASAFSANAIEVRVITYKSIGDYLVLNILKDYKDRSCEAIFTYFASGFNRDGLAVRTALGLMDESGHPQKYLIVITDGNPSDLTGIKNNKLFGRTMDYGGRAAIEDLAKEVTRGKSQGIKVVGLLIGRDENLEAMETIFGQNLLHLKDPIDMTDSLLRALRQ